MIINLNMEIKDSKSEVECKEIDGVTIVTFKEIVKIDRFNIEQRIKVLALLRGIKLGDIANKFGTSQASFSTRCKTGKLLFSEQRKIADILNCKIIFKFKCKDGKEFTGDSIKELVVNVLEYMNMSQSELAKSVNKSRQNFHFKLKNGRFTNEELAALAAKLNCDYETYFLLEDGTKI